MRLHALTIANIRAIEQLTLTELPDTGVIVISGANEQGKSTILDALTALQKYSHTSRAKPVREMARIGGEAPEASATMTVGPVTFTIEKRWLSRPRAALTVTAPTPANYSGGEAHDKLQEILAEHLDADLADTLFLRQDDMGKAVAAAGIPSLSGALAQANDSDGGVDAAEDDALMAAVQKEYLRYFTAGGAKNANYKAAERSEEQAIATVKTAQASVDELNHYVEQVATNERDRDRGTHELPGAEDTLVAARVALDQVQELNTRVEATAAALDRAQRDRDDAQRLVDERAAQRERLADLTAAAASLATDVAAAKEQAEEETTKVEQLRAALRQARDERGAALEAVRHARAVHQRLVDADELASVEELVATIAEHDATVARLRQAQPKRAITDADVRALDDAERELAVATALRDASVPKLDLSGSGPVTVDDVAVDVPSTVELIDGTVIAVGSVTATYRSGDTVGVEAAQRADEAARIVQELLADLGCSDSEQARRLRDDHARLAVELKEARDERSRVLAGRDSDEVRAQRDRLAEGLREDIEGTVGSVAEAKADVEAREAERDATDLAIQRIEQELEPWENATAAKQYVELFTRHDGLSDQIKNVKRSLDAAIETRTDEALAADVEAAQNAWDKAKESAEQAEKALTEADPQARHDAVDAAEARVKSITERINQATVTLAKLSGYIERATGAAEDLQEATAEAEAISHKLAGIARRAEAAQRLRDVLLRHREVARARYAQPFADELSSLARSVFGPDVQFSLDDDLTVTERTVGGATIDLHNLSGGAKEQLALLTRFSIANLVGNTVPIVVDDALGNTDEQRLQQMGGLFARMGRERQVIVLTCFPQRYDWVPGKTEYRIEELKRG